MRRFLVTALIESPGDPFVFYRQFMIVDPIPGVPTVDQMEQIDVDHWHEGITVVDESGSMIDGLLPNVKSMPEGSSIDTL